MLQFKKYKLFNSLMTIILVHVICSTAYAQKNYLPNEIYLKLRASTPIKLNRVSPEMRLAQFDKIISPNMVRRYGIETIKAPFYFSKSNILNRTFRMKFRDKKQMDDLLTELNRHRSIEYAERIPIDKLDFTPNDLGSYTTGGQWALYKIGAQSAWNVTTGDANIVVAVVDDAIQTTHEDLNGKCLAGWDVADNDNNPNPVGCHDHGTHVAGLVGANTNNGLGVASIGFNISILPIKATKDDDPCGSMNHGYAGIAWAADNGADVINMSWGVPESSITNANVIDYAWSQGCVLVAAAGNYASISPLYPANYENVISVAASTRSDVKAAFSNYGSWVDITAPGHSIRSTVISGGYGLKSGTSMAAPIVAGLCGLVWSVDTSQNQQDIVDCVLNTADNIDTQNPTYIGLLGSGRVNASQAVQCALGNTCPTNLSIFQTYTNGDFADLEASNEISSSSTINSGANVTFDASNEIILTTDFKALEGSEFLGVIDGCGGNYKLPKEPIILPPKLATDVQIHNAPNPFQEKTDIKYTLNQDTQVTIEVFDLGGRLISKLVENQFQTSGSYSLPFDARGLQSGIYIFQIQTDQTQKSSKMILLD